jgi:hypothetical protein
MVPLPEDFGTAGGGWLLCDGLQHAGSPSEETALEEKAYASFLGRPVGEGGVGVQEIGNASRLDLWAGSSSAQSHVSSELLEGLALAKSEWGRLLN